jgi:hypothetical protein
VVAAGVTVFEERPVTVPTPWLMDRLVAPDTFQASVLLAPAVSEDGVAVKEEMTGGCGGGVPPPAKP